MLAGQQHAQPQPHGPRTHDGDASGASGSDQLPGGRKLALTQAQQQRAATTAWSATNGALFLSRDVPKSKVEFAACVCALAMLRVDLEAVLEEHVQLEREEGVQAGVQRALAYQQYFASLRHLEAIDAGRPEDARAALGDVFPPFHTSLKDRLRALREARAAEAEAFDDF